MTYSDTLDAVPASYWHDDRDQPDETPEWQGASKMTLCNAGDCKEPAAHDGLCVGHYQRMNRARRAGRTDWDRSPIKPRGQRKTRPDAGFDIAAIREVAGLSTAELADGMGLSSYNIVGQLERRKDWLVSTVAAYVAAAGGTATLTVEVNGKTLEFPL